MPDHQSLDLRRLMCLVGVVHLGRVGVVSLGREEVVSLGKVANRCRSASLDENKGGFREGWMM